MNKRIFKYVFYCMYISGGMILSYFLPENSRFTLGFMFALLTEWCWRILTRNDNVQIVGRGIHTKKLIALVRVNGHLKPTYVKEVNNG
jgi:hypothetical protein